MTAGGKSTFWVLPPEIMEPLQREFQFDYDPIPFSAGFVQFDGFADVPDDKKSVWLNPLFGKGITKWVRWAIKQAKRGKEVVVILPLDNWVRLFVEYMGSDVGNIGNNLYALDGGAFKGRIVSLGSHDWLNPETGERRRSSRPSFLFIFEAQGAILVC